MILPDPSPGLRETLGGVGPSLAGTGNPIDLLGDADSGLYERVLSALIASGEAEAILTICTPQRMTGKAAVAHAIAGQASQAWAAGIPLLSAMAQFEVPTGAGRILDAAGIPKYPFAENALRALAAARRYRSWRESRFFLTGLESEAILQAYGIGCLRSVLVTSPQGLRKGARGIWISPGGEAGIPGCPPQG